MAKIIVYGEDPELLAEAQVRLHHPTVMAMTLYDVRRALPADLLVIISGMDVQDLFVAKATAKAAKTPYIEVGPATLVDLVAEALGEETVEQTD